MVYLPFAFNKCHPQLQHCRHKAFSYTVFLMLNPGTACVRKWLTMFWDQEFCSNRVSCTEKNPRFHFHKLTGILTQLHMSCCESISRHVSVARPFPPKPHNKLQPDHLKHYPLPNWPNDSASRIWSIYKSKSKSYADLFLATLNECQ